MFSRLASQRNNILSLSLTGGDETSFPLSHSLSGSFLLNSFSLSLNRLDLLLYLFYFAPASVPLRYRVILNDRVQRRTYTRDL